MSQDTAAHSDGKYRVIFGFIKKITNLTELNKFSIIIRFFKSKKKILVEKTHPLGK